MRRKGTICLYLSTFMYDSTLFPAIFDIDARVTSRVEGSMRVYVLNPEKSINPLRQKSQTTQAFPLWDWVNQSDPKFVAVSLGYRLGLLGFLSGNELQADGDANAGLLDQRAAIGWVQRNIARFGGDPDTITIDGESAGGASVIMQVVSYGGTTFYISQCVLSCLIARMK